MSDLPKVVISYSNKNLLQAIAAIDGIGGIVGTVATVGLQGVPKQVFSLEDAEEKGFTEGAEPSFHRHLKEFYEVVGGEQELWIMGLPIAMLKSDILDTTDPAGAIKLIKAANGAIRLLAVFSNAAVVGTDFFDQDVQAAVLAGQTFALARLAELIPLRILIEGKISDETDAVIYQPKSSSAGFCGVVVGGSLNNGTASIGTALGRACKYPAHVKIGKVANGPLPLSEVFIGTKKLSEFTGLAALHGYGVISFMQHPNKAGFYFGIDRMASTDDFRILAYGRVIDKAAVITAAVYIEELESEVDVNANGQISELDLEHLKGQLEQNVKANMGEQISKDGVSIIIDPKQNIISTGVLKLKLKITPKGYTSEIDIDLGLNAPSAS
jgi:hypothetical protein